MKLVWMLPRTVSNAPPAAGVPRPPMPKRRCGRDRQGKDLPGHELSVNPVDGERDEREHERGDGQGPRAAGRRRRESAHHKPAARSDDH